MFDTLWSKFVLQLNKGNPFFACLAMFTQVVADDRIEIGTTLGKEIRINPGFILSETDEKAFSYLLHQVLHLALQHDARGKGRDVEYWNIAADIVVNEIIVSSTSWPTAPSTAWDDRFTDCSVEQVYARLVEEFGRPDVQEPENQAGTGDSQGRSQQIDDARHDATVAGDDPSKERGSETDSVNDKGGESGEESDKREAGSRPSKQGRTGAADADEGNFRERQHDRASARRPGSNGTAGPRRSVSKLYRSHSDLTQPADSSGGSESADARYWKDATAQARLASNGRQAGHMPASLLREFERIERSGVNWQRELWRFISDRQSDFTEFDARHIHRGLYVEQLRVDGLNLCVAIDTSGSIDRDELSVFMAELDAIRRLYADVKVSLYYCDTAIDGPHTMNGRQAMANPPTGNGGTSFQPVFDAIGNLSLADRPDCLIYFTDGEAEFPSQPGSMPTLWMLTSDGNREESEIPFGTSLRMAPAAA